MNLLKIKALRVYFPTDDGIVKAVDGVDLNIKREEILGLIGETGCGKTVLGMSIMRLIQSTTLTDGEIIYKDRDLLSLSDDEMRKIRGGEIAMVLQNPMTSLNPVIRVGEQIAETIRLHQGLDKKAARKRVIEMLRDVRIPDPEKSVDSYPHQLSGGMQERVMIAMALASDPELIIADEPTKGLDVTVKREIIRLMKEVTAKRSMLFITHDLGAAAEICDNIAVMYAGELLEHASVDSIFSEPLHPYSEGLLNSLPERGLKPIRGISPSLIDTPQGCRFHPRCDYAMEICREKHPEMVKLEDGRAVRCFLYA
ncbi:MAG: ABC transporter ATP-binding protein [Candidatus Syntropharchaeales archaeon]|uniref:Nickel import system ATP-binding protein NikD n=1 Tax=Candidatus Syntropharchaeum caldarium TaxID=1838285 RepID=A0A1F2PCQ3_9EURY|nr:ABC transporter ATP-binding protein [Candidatus Syntrophoarchaeum sp.]OFV68662.1 MAG: peptide ABC transporter ATP-binding protein [Candidatus Syntrophoarchaeum caldarius]